MKPNQILQADPIIIGGCGRSGTTLLLSILSSHPRIAAIPFETSAFCTGSKIKPDKYLIDEQKLLNALHRLSEKKSAVRLVEKTPRNILNTENIIEYLSGNVKIIHIVRDGRDVVTSKHPSATIKSTWIPTRIKRPIKYALRRIDHKFKIDSWLRKHALAQGTLGNILNEAVKHTNYEEGSNKEYISARRWVHDVSCGRDAERFKQVLTVKYEDLVCDFSRTLIRICEHIEEEPVNAIANWFENTTVRTNSAIEGSINNIHAQSIGRWKEHQYSDRVAKLLDIDGARALLSYYGYLDEGR